jgi:hypothetical protein
MIVKANGLVDLVDKAGNKTEVWPVDAREALNSGEYFLPGAVKEKPVDAKKESIAPQKVETETKISGASVGGVSLNKKFV